MSKLTKENVLGVLLSYIEWVEIHDDMYNKDKVIINEFLEEHMENMILNSEVLNIGLYFKYLNPSIKQIEKILNIYFDNNLRPKMDDIRLFKLLDSYISEDLKFKLSKLLISRKPNNIIKTIKKSNVEFDAIKVYLYKGLRESIETNMIVNVVDLISNAKDLNDIHNLIEKGKIDKVRDRRLIDKKISEVLNNAFNHYIHQ